MAQEYTIDIVSEKIKNWSNNYGDFTTYTVKFPDSDDAVQLNKKSDSPAPKEGDVLYGEITETEFGKRFKSEQKPFGESKPSGSQNTYKDNSKNITLGLVWKVLIGIQGVPENDEQFAKFYETVNMHVSELLSMAEKLQNE